MAANTALLLIAHGSNRYPDAAAGLLRHAAALRATGAFHEVEAGLLNGAPSVAEALARISAASVRVVPLFMESGHFTRVAIPRALGIANTGAHPRFHLCSPIGLHDAMAGLIERQALAGCAALGCDPRSVAVLVIGHGSASAPGRALALHEHTARAGWNGLFASVGSACLEEAPFVADALRARRHHPLVVVGFFAGDGGHVRDDLPALVAAEQAARGAGGLPIRLQGTVMDDPEVTSLILDQAAL
ncbi:CbiX/SirB N-terminal domain-containing protein [Rhodopila globiformis]|uniref:CbiX/SirB N-terminal domain-containing protein n=1 Tax=Rhodopila globiformis TaxID=1071 RepID=UPI0011B06018|nr:CbiX/SirB N-terminal domain-containing protein [Rhodopila globiformis]